MDIKTKRYINKYDPFNSLLKLQTILLDTLEFKKVTFRVVNAILFELGFIELGYKIIVLTLYNPEKKILERVALSQTKEAEETLKVSAIPFHDIDIPISENQNLLVKSFKEKKLYITHSWPEIFTPVLTSEQALTNQKAAGIKTSMIYPVFVRDEVIGVLIFSMIKSEKEVTKEEKSLIKGFSEIVGLSVQNSQLYTSLQVTTERLRKANIRLKELDALKDEFVSIASHELRTPMTAIKSYLWMAINKTEGPIKEPMKKYLEISYASTERLIHLVNDMLTVSRIERNKIEIKPELFDVQEILQLVYDELKISAEEKKIDFKLLKSKEKAMVKADKIKLREVYQNLVGNALKFTPPAGKISIEVKTTAKQVRVSVVDTGPGIPKESMDQLFQKFSKIDYSYANHVNQPGTGLGLYISKQIVSLHGGTIEVESEVKKGSTFTVVLPKGGA